MSKTIAVEYYPSDLSPLPFNEREWEFQTYDEFKQWVQQYVCIYCLVDFAVCHCKIPSTLQDWLATGCGYEIGITDESNIIKWDDDMVLPVDFIDRLTEEQEIMVNVFERHG